MPLRQTIENPQADLVAALIQRLSPERRRDLAVAAAQTRFIELLEMHEETTIEDFFRALQADPHWGLLKDLLVSDVISDGRELPGAMETAASGLLPQVS